VLESFDGLPFVVDQKTGSSSGGIESIARVLECDPKTIRLGLGELEGGDDLDTGRSRKKGVAANR